MSHDIDDLLALIQELEERILDLEKLLALKKFEEYMLAVHNDDAWYWEHG